MGVNSITYNDRVRYQLQHKTYGSLIITEPIGWENDEKEYARHEVYHGILTKFSNSLKFIDDGANYITFIKDVYGINDNIRLTRDEKNPNTDIWERSYYGDLDLSTYEISNREVSIKFNSSGLEQLLKSRESEKVEIERDTSMDGDSIGDLVMNTTKLNGRQIFLMTTYKENETNDSTYMYNTTANDNVRGASVGIPLKLVGKSHENAHTVIPQTAIGDNSFDRSAVGDVGMMFFAVSDLDRTLRISFKISFKFVINNTHSGHDTDDYDDLDWSMFWLRLATYKDGSDLNYKEDRVLAFLGYDGVNDSTHHDVLDYNFQTLTYTFDETINLLTGESLSLQFSQLMRGKYAVGHQAHLKINCEDIDIEYFSIEEDSFFEATTAKTILSHDLGNRLIQIITGKEDLFYSEILGRQDIGYSSNGEASFLGFTHGFWVRNFDRFPEDEENKYKGFTTSFKEYLESMFALRNLGLGIERLGFKERVRVEKMEYFYNGNILINLPNQVQNVKRSIAKEYYYSGIEVGFLKGGEYEEAMGLDEYNAKSTFTTVITRLKKSYKALSKYRGDSYGKEFARRKQISSYPTEDTTYDKDIFVMDLKQGIGVLEERLWQDDFEQAPTGVFSPETATNLRLSPFNTMLLHGWNISTGFIKYASDYVRYGSSVANSGLTTKLVGGNEYSENGNIINSELQRPRYIPEWIEFEHEVNFDLIKQVEGTTIISGKETPNFYGKVQFINEIGEKEKGFLFSLKPNKKGKWKILKSN